MFETIKRIFQPRPEPAPRIHTVEAKAPTVSIKRATGGALRGGMWVKLGDRVGILKDMNEFSVCSVMLVDADGFNLVEMSVPAGELSQCKAGDIPAGRVAHLGPEALQAMGYAQ